MYLIFPGHGNPDIHDRVCKFGVSKIFINNKLIKSKTILNGYKRFPFQIKAFKIIIKEEE